MSDLTDHQDNDNPISADKTEGCKASNHVVEVSDMVKIGSNAKRVIISNKGSGL